MVFIATSCIFFYIEYACLTSVLGDYIKLLFLYIFTILSYFSFMVIGDIFTIFVFLLMVPALKVMVR